MSRLLDQPGTRILATLGPASSSVEMIEALARAGASAFRLNFSHGEHDAKRELVGRVREVSRRIERPLTIVGDLCGPKRRTRLVEGGEPFDLKVGESVVI